ncbi:MAG: glycine dehydrogenase subunit 1 [Candidatus Sumerlaeota bacterium]|nr:glycine dehydrogenase subunit 1 [Candidatus Sumerlaeota bacterium]
MPYLPHTADDIAGMLATIGVSSIDELFADIPEGLMLDEPLNIGSMNEYEIVRYFECAANQNRTVEPGRLFLGAGAYNHYTPAAVKALLQRGEFLTSYTPYQAEVSQGTLQAIFEFQSHICSLTALDVANASMYDGATALSEALAMAVRHNRGRIVYLPEALHPNYRAVCHTFMRELDVEIRPVPMKNGLTDYEAIELGTEKVAAVVVNTPNFYGILEDHAAAKRLAEKTKALLIAVCNPVALALVTPPGDFGADIAVGEAQPLGIPLQYGGPYAGYFACRQSLIRKMPGRLVGRTTDGEGRPGYTLTLQTREQHIRREKATSNICTNQGLFALMVTMHLTFVGRQGLVEVAETCVARTHELAERLISSTDIAPTFPDAPYFHEVALRLPMPAADFVTIMREEHDIVAGYDLGKVSPDLANDLLVCVTEMMTPLNIDEYLRGAKATIEQAQSL